MSYRTLTNIIVILGVIIFLGESVVGGVVLKIFLNKEKPINEPIAETKNIETDQVESEPN